MTDYLIQGETLENLGNAVRNLSGNNAEMTPAQMTMTINETKSVIDSLNEHKADKNNPHEVNAEKIKISETLSSALGVSAEISAEDAFSLIKDNIDNVNNILFGGSTSTPFCWKTFQYVLDDSNIGNVQISVSGDSGTYDQSFYVSTSYNVNLTTGKVTLTNPTIVSNLTTSWKNYINYYIMPTNVSSTNQISQITANSSTYSWTEGHSAGPSSPVTYVSYTVLQNCKAYKWDYKYTGVVKSENESTYPNEAWSNNIYYIKFEGASMQIPKMAAGKYVGSGKYGSTNPVVLSFDFEPKIVVVCCNFTFTKTYKLSAFEETRNNSTTNTVQMAMVYVKNSPYPIAYVHKNSLAKGLKALSQSYYGEYYTDGTTAYGDLNENSSVKLTPNIILTTLSGNNLSFYSTKTFSDSIYDYYTGTNTATGKGADWSAIAQFNSSYGEYTYFAFG